MPALPLSRPFSPRATRVHPRIFFRVSAHPHSLSSAPEKSQRQTPASNSMAAADRCKWLFREIENLSLPAIGEFRAVSEKLRPLYVCI